MGPPLGSAGESVILAAPPRVPRGTPATKAKDLEPSKKTTKKKLICLCLFNPILIPFWLPFGSQNP